MEEISNWQRALWTFLGYTLLGPFFGGLYVAAVLLLAPVLKLEAFVPQGLPPLGSAAISAFIWCAIPAALCAVMLLGFVIKRGTFGWVEAAGAGVIAFGIAAVVTGPVPGSLPSLAFMAGLISLGVRQVLLNGDILIDADS